MADGTGRKNVKNLDLAELFVTSLADLPLLARSSLCVGSYPSSCSNTTPPQRCSWQKPAAVFAKHHSPHKQSYLSPWCIPHVNATTACHLARSPHTCDPLQSCQPWPPCGTATCTNQPHTHTLRHTAHSPRPLAPLSAACWFVSSIHFSHPSTPNATHSFAQLKRDTQAATPADAERVLVRTFVAAMCVRDPHCCRSPCSATQPHNPHLRSTTTTSTRRKKCKGK